MRPRRRSGCLSRYRAEAPLSGQRALTAACLAAVRPLAGGFGMETAMTIDAVRAGFRVVEIPVAGLDPSGHRPDAPRLPPPGTPGAADRTGLDAAGGAVAVRGGRLAVANHRGVMVPRTLGLWLAGAALVSSAAVAAFGEGSVTRAGWGALAATMLVFAAGLVDDLVPNGPRGIREPPRGVGVRAT